MAGIKMAGMALKALEQAVPLLGAASDPGRDVLSAIKLVSKHVPPGSVSPSDVMQILQKLMLQQQQFGQQMNQMRQQGAQPAGQQPAGGGGPPPASGGAPPQQPRAA